MGACYGKASGSYDPDKAPYDKGDKRQKKAGKKASSAPEAIHADRPAEGDNGQRAESPPVGAERKGEDRTETNQDYSEPDKHSVKQPEPECLKAEPLLSSHLNQVLSTPVEKKTVSPRKLPNENIQQPSDEYTSTNERKDASLSAQKEADTYSSAERRRKEEPTNVDKQRSTDWVLGRQLDTTGVTTAKVPRTSAGVTLRHEDVLLEVSSQPTLKTESPSKFASASTVRQQTDMAPNASIVTKSKPLGFDASEDDRRLDVKADENKGRTPSALVTNGYKEASVKLQINGEPCSELQQPAKTVAAELDKTKVVLDKKTEQSVAQINDRIEKITIQKSQISATEVAKAEVEIIQKTVTSVLEKTETAEDKGIEINAKDSGKQAADVGIRLKDGHEAAAAKVENGSTDVKEDEDIVHKLNGMSDAVFKDHSMPPSADRAGKENTGSATPPGVLKLETTADDRVMPLIADVKETAKILTTSVDAKTHTELSSATTSIPADDSKPTVNDQQEDSLRISPEEKKIEAPSQSVLSNIPSPTSHGGFGYAKERKTSASSLKHASTGSKLKRTPSETSEGTPRGKQTEDTSKELKPSPTLKKQEEFLAEKLAKDEIPNVLSDFSHEMETVLARYEICPNTRVRLINHVCSWVRAEERDKSASKRVWLLTGQAGIGKSTVAAEVYRKMAGHGAVGHFFRCRHPNLDYNDARYVVQWLARQLCAVLPAYADALRRSQRQRDAMDSENANELFTALITEPLSAGDVRRDPKDGLLIVLDAIDESSPETRDELLQLINAFDEKTPRWLFLLVTLRDDNQIASRLKDVNTVEMRQSSDNLGDIKKYLKQPMSKHMDRISLDGGLTQLVKKTEGSFLCARILAGILDQLPAERLIAIREVDAMFPKGVGGCYAAVFRSFRDDFSKVVSSKELDEKYQSIVGLLCCSLEPMPTAILDQMIGVNSDCLNSLRPVLDVGNGYFSLHNRHAAEWLRNEQESGDLHVNTAISQKYLANWCLALLSHIRDRSGSDHPVALQQYALKHVIWHLLDVPKQQDNVAGLLCELRYIRDKLSVPTVKLRHLLADYNHSHYGCYGDGRKLVSMSEYMNKHPKLLGQLNSYRQFLTSQRRKIEGDPRFVLLVAANYQKCERIQQNALVELEEQPWIEDRTVIQETHHINVSYPGRIEDIDLSSDGKTLALIVSEEKYSTLVLLNASTGEKKIRNVDLRSLDERTGSCVRFLPDDNTVFVGSLTTYINVKQGNHTASGIDVNSVQMKEKYIIECCAISKKLMVCGLSTLPTGGRSLHLAVLNMKAKKCSRVIEVLKFRFGGSSLFGIKSCALSEDDTLICTLVKESNKAQFVCSVWSVSKGTNIYKVNVTGENLSKCLFADDGSVLVGTGIRSWLGSEATERMEPAKLWNFKANQPPAKWDEKELGSLFSTHKSGFVDMKWYTESSHASVEMRKNKNEVVQTYRLDGLRHARDIIAASEQLVVLTREDIRIYSLNDLIRIEDGEVRTMTPSDVRVTNMTYHPRREQIVMSYVNPGTDDINTTVLDLLADDLVLSPAPVSQTSLNPSDKQKFFHGRTTKTDMCQYSADGSMVIVNDRRRVLLWNTASNTSEVIVEIREDIGLECIVSQRDNLMAVVYPDTPYKIQIFDLKCRQAVTSLALADEDAVVSDFLFMQYSGQLLAYHQDAGNTLTVWNPRSGDTVHQQKGVDVVYLRSSPASDRMAINLRLGPHQGCLLLRNSDNKFSIKLKIPEGWLPSGDTTDAEFVADGTALVGVASPTGVVRIWNAGNGDVLMDWKMDFDGPVDVLGVITNAHVVLHDRHGIRVVDVTTGATVTNLRTDDGLARKTEPLGMKVSPRGGTIVGSTRNGQLKVFHCHNYSSLKRKTTLQILKAAGK